MQITLHLTPFGGNLADSNHNAIICLNAVHRIFRVGFKPSTLTISNQPTKGSKRIAVRRSISVVLYLDVQKNKWLPTWATLGCLLCEQFLKDYKQRSLYFKLENL